MWLIWSALLHPLLSLQNFAYSNITGQIVFFVLDQLPPATLYSPTSIKQLGNLKTRTYDTVLVAALGPQPPCFLETFLTENGT